MSTTGELGRFKDIHKGQRGFIIACGPSLKDIDLSLLNEEIVLGTSLAYKSGVKLDYSFMGDKKIASQFWKDMFYLPFHLFVSRSIMLTYFLDRPRTYYFSGSQTKKFHTDLSSGVLHGGGTSTFLAMQLAYWMGLDTVYVVGLDHYKSFSEKKIKAKETGRKNLSGQPLVTATGKDNHHFSKDYYGKGTEYFLPTVGKMEASYNLARLAFESDGRKICNASTITALSEDVLPRVTFQDII